MDPHAASTSPGEGIDRKQLRQLLARFGAISAARLERVRGMLAPRHCQFLELLPLLLHVNHPALPGYVSQQAPCGISGYTPSATELALAKRLWRSFTPHRGAGEAAQVHAVYLMGSPGTLGHSDASDLDIWVCYPEELAPEALALLARKAALLGEWASSIGLEAHLFLMSGEKFRRGQREPLTGENCGSAQHYLLLDEFYRTGILLAGRVPAWWLIPPALESRHDAWCEQLVEKRYVPAELVDFGGISALPAGEFVGAGIWQLYKAIDSPYKSVLKLLLFEVYAADYPDTVCLSADYKRAVWAGETDIDELDPYVMIYRRIESHLLARGQAGRLEIVRRCLYYKAGKKLSEPPRNGNPSWQRRLMERLTAQWGWDKAKLALLDARSQWRIQEVETERNELVKELTLSYRFLSEFARHGADALPIDAQEFSVLGRKLYAAYERKAGKIDAVNPGRAINVTERELAIGTVRGPDGTPARWAAWAGSAREPGLSALRQSASLTELLAWCVVNGVIGEQTGLAVREGTDGLRTSELRAMVDELRRHIVEAEAVAGDDAFGHAARLGTLLVFVNVAVDPMREARASGLQRVSSRTDALGFSALRENLVLNLETVQRNSWGETIGTRHEGVDGLLRCLGDFLQLVQGQAAVRPLVVVRCFCASRAEPIAARVAELFADVERYFHHERGGANARYVLEIANRLHVLQHRRGASSASSADGPVALYQLLGAPQPEWCSLALDRHALERAPLPAIATRITPSAVNVFSEPRAEAIALTIVDERGSFLHAEYPGARETSLLAAVDQFLTSVRYRQNTAAGIGTGAVPEAVPPRYYRLARSAGGDYAAQELAAPESYRSTGFLNVQAIAERRGEALLFTVYCGGATFAQAELGEAFHAQLAAHIRSLRQSTERYPVYITDLDLSALAPDTDAPLQTVHYLREKQRLEAAINRALAGTV